MGYKEEREQIDKEYRDKLNQLEEQFKKYALYQEGDIVLYNAHKYDFANKYDDGHTLSIGIIGGLELDNNDIRYIMRFTNTYTSDTVTEPEIIKGPTTCTITEKDIILKLGVTSMKLTDFLKSFIKYEK